MRLCYLADASSIHTQKWVSYFAEYGHDVHVISFDGTEIPNVKCHKLTLPTFMEKARKKSRALKIIMFPLKFLITLLTLRQLIYHINPDVLHAHYITNYGFFGALTGFKPYIVTAWGSDILNIVQNRVLSFARTFMSTVVLAKADLITSDGEHMIPHMLRLGAEASKIHTVNFGVDTDKFKPHKTKHDGLIVISTRKLDPIYNVNSLIMATPTVIAKLPETKFLIVGTGSQEHGLKQLAKELNVTDNVQFLGTVPNDAMPTLLNSADVYVSTSLSDAGIAASTAEAMACELPIIATDNSDNKEWIQDGIIVPNSDVASLEKALITLLEVTSVHKRFGQANRAIIINKNDYRKEMLKMETLYENLSHRRSRLNWQ